MKPEYSTFPIEEITGQLRIEFEPVAKAKGIELTVMPPRWWSQATAACCAGFCRT